jgi:hypothetical protein
LFRVDWLDIRPQFAGPLPVTKRLLLVDAALLFAYPPELRSVKVPTKAIDDKNEQNTVNRYTHDCPQPLGPFRRPEVVFDVFPLGMPGVR